MADLGWQSALGGRALDEASIGVFETDRRTMIDVRILPSGARGKAAIAKALGFDLPTEPRTSTATNQVTALWLSIDQWLVVAPHEKGEAILKALVKAAAGGKAVVTDLSDARTVIRLEGNGARQTVMKGGAADLLAADFIVGSVRRLNFAGIGAMVHYCSDQPDVLDLYVFRSFADYAIRWLEVASRSGAAITLFGPSPPPPS
ncbi:hypothetical protein MNBD_ALPHA09-266 [hydrothermal vent metagenome]|uniref:Sarcosine oxidase gamma subunit n=1 Tax=hydrothermal vent metagenome TaxID=652676 RepID=A0A3B0TJL4_9ZZZZ